MNIVYSYNVFDLGQCNLKERDSSLLSIPKLQRGKVWKARQIELLWDSLLRNFPIGTIIVLSDNLRAETPRGELIDGQQRVSAMIAAFQQPTPNSDCVVWVDLNADELQDRKYAIRVTNRAHPWGYNLDGSVYRARERRNAIIDAEETPGSNKSQWNILNFGPNGKNILPVPLIFLLEAHGEDKVQFVIDKCKELAEVAPAWKKKYFDSLVNIDKTRFDRYFNAINRLSKTNTEQYLIPAIVIDSKEDLDLLFSRIGTQGTAITSKELAYALMKSYWEGDAFGPVNEFRAKGIVSEEDFAQIMFRLFTSKKDLRGEITPEYVRSLSGNSLDDEKESIKNDILQAYSDNGEIIGQITQLVDDWLLSCEDGDGKYHPIIRTEIASKHPGLYIVLLRLALIHLDGRLKLSPRFVQAMAFYLHVCLWNEKTISLVYRQIMAQAGDVTEPLILDALREAISFEWAMAPVSSFKDFPALKEEALDADWAIDHYQKELGYYLFERLFTYGNAESAFILKLAEHNYFNKQYSDYNPTRKDLWEDQNRPWDHDHIVPQNWQGDNQPWSNFCALWINSIGNIADIPFELNREKQDAAEWDYYAETEHAKDLLFFPNDDFFNLNEHLSENGSSEQRKTFFNFVKERFLLIVEPFLGIIGRLGIHDGLSEKQLLRKRLLLKAREENPGCLLYYLQNGIEYTFDDSNNYAWQQSWLTLSKDIGDKERVAAISIAINEDGSFEAQCGLRKRPELYVEQMSNHSWWATDGRFMRGKVWPNITDDMVIAISYYGWNPLNSFSELLMEF